jgi:hypothetical protein
VLESDFATIPYTVFVRGLTADGTQVSWEAAPPNVMVWTIWQVPIFADTFGGIIATVAEPSDPYTITGLARFAAPDGQLPWMYQSPWTITSRAQAPDGTVYLIESTQSPEGVDTFARVVGLDGETGAVKFRKPLPASDFSIIHPHPKCQTGQTEHTTQSQWAPPWWWAKTGLHTSQWASVSRPRILRVVMLTTRWCPTGNTLLLGSER